MKTLVIIVATAFFTWIVFSFISGLQTGVERLWLISAVKAPGRMALSNIQADMNAGKYDLAKAKINIFMNTWKRFESGPDSFKGPGIGDIMGSFGKLDTDEPTSTTNALKTPNSNGHP